MKYIGKNNTSLIIVCVFIGILICYFTMCNCRMNYGLIEGMDTGTTGTTGTTGPKLSDMKGAMAAAAAAATGSKAKPKPTPEPSPPPVPPMPAPPSTIASNTTAGPSSSTKNAAALATATPAGKENFEQQGRPLSYGPLQESKSDDWNLSKWVKNATRYAKGMGNENRLDSYKYNTGPKIPLPEGELFFFKDTKFSPEACPGTYSNSMGCAMMSQDQFNYLVTRAGNNTAPAGRKTSYYNDL
jgi:hypothetical protein